MNTIDLRADTVTHPTPAMRQAMFEAEVGDDWFSEDPTVKRLERVSAEAMGKEAGLFMASGTMANLTAVLTHTQRGDRVVAGDQAHILYYEGDGQRRLAGVELVPVPNGERGTLDPAEVERALSASHPAARLVCLENTHNRCAGGVVTAAETAAIASVAHAHGAGVHLDGARIFNAAVTLDVPASELAASVDSVTFCLSKGLSCPIGSVLCSTGDFIAGARQARRMVGGAMRQAGVVAAAGIVALESMIERLAEDHANAKVLAKGLASIRGLRIDPEAVQTNFAVVELELGSPADFVEALRRVGVRAVPFGPNLVRFVTHADVSRDDVEEALERVRQVCGAMA